MVSENGDERIACPDCAAAVGLLHEPGCDVEQCAACGGQRISCDCRDRPRRRLIWTGLWPGVLECRQMGLYCRLTGVGWVVCGKDDPGAREDLNRLLSECIWDRKAGRFVARTARK